MEIDNYSVIHTASSRHGFIEYFRRLWISFTNNLPYIAFLPSFVGQKQYKIEMYVCRIRFVKLKTYYETLMVGVVVGC